MKLAIMKFFDKTLAALLLVFRKKKLLSESPRRVLVIKLSAMGDAVCLMPAIRQLHQAYNNVQIDWLTSKRSVPGLFVGIKFIRRIYIFPTGLIDLLIFFGRNFFVFQKYDIIIDFDQYYRISELISFFGKTNAGFSTEIKGSKYSISIPYDPIKNEKLIFSDLVNIVISKHQGVLTKYSPLLPELLNDFVPSDRLKRFANQCSMSMKPVLVLYPGSSPNAIYRRWPISRYIELIRQFDQNCHVILAGGPDESSLKVAIAQAGYSSVDHMGEWSLHEWLWIFRNLKGIFVGNDAGLLHLAESQGMPIIGLFGPNIYSKWGSINPDSIGVETALACRPCIKSYLGYVPKNCLRGDVKCLMDVSIENVAFLINSKLAAYNIDQ